MFARHALPATLQLKTGPLVTTAALLVHLDASYKLAEGQLAMTAPGVIQLKSQVCGIANHAAMESLLMFRDRLHASSVRQVVTAKKSKLPAA